MESEPRHEKVLTTFLSYGEVTRQRQGEIIRNLSAPQQEVRSDVNEIVDIMLKKLKKGVDLRAK
jgi:RNA-binding protein YlmH